MGPREALCTGVFTVSGLNWIAPPPEGETAAEVQVSYRSRPAPCALRPLDDRTVEVRPTDPLPSVSPGQAAVFYRGDRVLGGGWIDKAADRAGIDAARDERGTLVETRCA